MPQESCPFATPTVAFTTRTHRLFRSGPFEPLSFRGRILAENRGQPAECRRHLLRLFETDGRKLVVGIEYRSDYIHRRGGQERNHYEAHVIDGGLPEAAACLLAYDPAPHAVYDQRPSTLAALRQQYAEQVRQLLAGVKCLSAQQR